MPGKYSSMAQLLPLSLALVILFGTVLTNTSKRQSKHKADKIIRNICEKLYDGDLESAGNRKWEILCDEWIKSLNHKQHQDIEDENVMDEQHMTPIMQPRKARGGGGGGSRGSGIRTSGGSRLPSISRYRNTRTGATISRPTGYQWSRSRLTFLPLSTRFLHRSRSSSNRYTTRPTTSLIYYYCTSTLNNSAEIQCSSYNNDAQCCEDETTHDVFCCGGDIPDDIKQDTNRAARIFYTLAALALCIHLLIRRFCQ